MESSFTTVFKFLCHIVHFDIDTHSDLCTVGSTVPAGWWGYDRKPGDRWRGCMKQSRSDTRSACRGLRRRRTSVCFRISALQTDSRHTPDSSPSCSPDERTAEDIASSRNTRGRSEKRIHITLENIGTTVQWRIRWQKHDILIYCIH